MRASMLPFARVWFQQGTSPALVRTAFRWQEVRQCHCQCQSLFRQPRNSIATASASGGSRSTGRSSFNSNSKSRTFSRKSSSSSSSSHTPRKSLGRPHPRSENGRKRTAVLAAAATLSPGALFLAGKEGEEDPESTAEESMLAASRAEIERIVPEDSRGLRRLLWDIVYLLDRWVWEPVATAVRFAHLVVIFVPVVASAPAVLFGARQKDRGGERSGTLWWYGFLVRAMEQAGAAFIKLGQWAASRRDIFPEELCDRLATLHSDAPAHSLKDTRRIIVAAFGGRKFEDIFDEFDEKPLGVGAIAQVYKARLKPDLAALADTDLEQPSTAKRMRRNVDALVKSTPSRAPSSYVAVKVLHPKIERIVRRDLKIMAVVASMLNAIPTLEWLSFPDEVAMFGEMMKLQLDLRIEAANLTMFRRNFTDRNTAWFPYPYSDYTTRQVLVEEFAHGIPLEGFLNAGGGPFQKELADEGMDSFLRMLLIDNFTHADLHPGNIMVRFYKPERVELPFGRHKEADTPDRSTDVTDEVMSKLKPFRKEPEKWIAQLEQIDREGYRPQLIFIDAGLVTALNDTNRRNFLDLFKALAEFDGYRAGHLMIERCRQPEAVVEGEIFALKMQHLVLGVKSRTFALGNIRIGDLLNRAMGMVREHHVRMEGDFINVVLSILLLEGIGRTLDPDMDLFKSALPILRSLGTQSGGSSLARSVWQGDFSMLKVWLGLETRGYLQGLQDDVERCVKYDLLSPNF